MSGPTVKSFGQSIPVVVRTPQPTRPPSAQPPKIGLVEISKIETAETPESILAKLLTVDGPGSGLNADLLDGQHGQYYVDLINAIGTLPPSTLVPTDILTALLQVDGAGSGLDADLLDGQHGAYYATAAGLAANDLRDNTQDTRLGAVEGVNTTQNSRLDANDTLNNTQNSRLTSIEQLNSTQDGRLTTAEAGIISLQSTKANIASPVFTGDPQAPTPPTADNDQSIATTAFVKAQGYIPDAPSDGLTYGRRSQQWATIVGGAVISPTAPTGPLQAGQLWWNSETANTFIWYTDANSSQWIQQNAVGPGAAGSGGGGVGPQGPAGPPGPGLISYSLTEQDTGTTWIDGKKIYQRSIDLASWVSQLGPNNYFGAPHGIANVDLFTECILFLRRADGAQMFLPRLDPSDMTFATGFYLDLVYINVTNGAASRAAWNSPAIATLRYTCTDR